MIRKTQDISHHSPHKFTADSLLIKGTGTLIDELYKDCALYLGHLSFVLPFPILNGRFFTSKIAELTFMDDIAHPEGSGSHVKYSMLEIMTL